MKETWAFPSNDHSHIQREQPPSSAQSPATTHVTVHTVDGKRAGLGIAYMEETREHAREIQKKVKRGSKPHRPSSHLSRWMGQTHFLWTRSSSDVGTEGGHFLPESESKKPVSCSKCYVHCRGPGGGPLQSVTRHFLPNCNLSSKLKSFLQERSSRG